MEYERSNLNPQPVNEQPLCLISPHHLIFVCLQQPELVYTPPSAPARHESLPSKHSSSAVSPVGVHELDASHAHPDTWRSVETYHEPAKRYTEPRPEPEYEPEIEYDAHDDHAAALDHDEFEYHPPAPIHTYEPMLREPEPAYEPELVEEKPVRPQSAPPLRRGCNPRWSTEYTDRFRWWPSFGVRMHASGN